MRLLRRRTGFCAPNTLTGARGELDMTDTWTCPEGHEVTTDFCPHDGHPRPKGSPGRIQGAQR